MQEPLQEDNDLEVDSSEDEEAETEITPLHYELSIYPADFTLDGLYRKWKDEDIILPKFQRRFVWDIKRSSRLIESVMMGLPVPPIFFHLREDNKFEVIDGMQRLKSIFFFMDGIFSSTGNTGGKHIFSIKGINPESKLCGKTFENFDDIDRRKFRNYVLRATVIKQLNPSKDVTSIYHIFERLNTGGMTLRDQEVRNCVYDGKLNDLLIELNKYESWRKILGKDKEDKRQKDVGYVLRCLSLFHNHKQYKKPIRDFLFRIHATQQKSIG